MKRALATACLLAASATAAAHDTWFEPLADGTLSLGTGTRFPKRESGIGVEYLRQHGCQRAETGVAPLTPLHNTDDALLFTVPAGAVSCWMQLMPFEIDLPADKIGIYLNEVRPPKAVLDAWAGMQARGLPWHERYTKHARIERPGGGTPRPSDMDMDVLLDSAQAPRVGQPIGFQVLRDGLPLADFAVELRSDRTPFGLWRRTDAEGRVQFQPPLAGQWILRGVDLRLSEDRPDTFDSRFVTLAFTVAPKARTAAP
jgi:hypothetical protein